MRLCLTCIALWMLGCDEPDAPAAPAPEPPPETPPEVGPEPPPSLETIAAPIAGRAVVAVPTLANGWTYPLATLEAGFGKDAELWLIELKPMDDTSPSVQLTFHGSELEPGTHRVLLERDGITHVFTVALGRTQLRVIGGEIVLTAVDEAEVEGTLDLEVRHPLHASPTRLGGRFYATRERYYDAALEHERAIREQLRRGER